MNGEVSSDALTAFAVFAEHLNFTRAAAELHISQPALHVKVAKLARTLDRPLYHRSGRRLVLTPDGEAVARFARDHDERLTRFLGELRATPPHQPVILAAGQGAYLYLLGPVIRDSLPARLRLVNGDRSQTLAAVRTGRAHIGVAVLDTLPDDLTTELLASYPQTAILPATHPLARRRRLRLRDLAGAALVVPPPQRPHRIALERALRAAGVEWSVAVEAEGWPLTLHFVSLGLGLAVVNGCVTPTAGLVSRPLADLPDIPYYAFHRPGALDDPRVADLLTRTRTHLASPPPP
ncbi:LysR family transcriptional regulator [Phytohabitans flavus]|uniref:LysR family transcriptional regulator n=1 Tax=Phytohabitans flavus TaxID=1076124 RepID=UPI0031E5E811